MNAMRAYLTISKRTTSQLLTMPQSTTAKQTAKHNRAAHICALA
jgi:hypothetical protein